MKSLLFFVLLGFVVIACETVYNPKLEEVDDVIAVDARIIVNSKGNLIKIFRTVGYNERSHFIPITGAEVEVMDDNNNIYPCPENDFGEYVADFQINPDRKYKLIFSVENENYVSDFSTVPTKPEIDTLYMEEQTKLVRGGGINSVDYFKKTLGQQSYVDIKEGTEQKFYRFFGRLILQYTFPFDTTLEGNVVMSEKFAWKSFYPSGSFNIAGPSNYSTSFEIKKHPLEFFRYNPYDVLTLQDSAKGWIYIIQQFSITKESYNFYKDLNYQLEATGKIFDPVYLQVRGNLICTSDENKIILGNFELDYYKEHRYYINVDPLNGEDIIIRKINNFYDIPFFGDVAVYPPVFWERVK